MNRPDDARPAVTPAAAPLAAAIAMAAAALFGAPLFAQGTAAAPEEAAPATIVSRDVVAATGDTVLEIARRELGSAAFARPLAEYNGLDDPEAPLAAGTVVRVPIHAPARGETARVAFVKGQVSRAGLPLDKDALISEGDVIETGPNGFVSLEFSSGTVVNLQPDSAASVERLACREGDDSCVIDISATRGEVGSEVEQRDGQPVEFRISTPFASAAVRGTEFETITDGQELRVSVTEGEIEVEAQGETVAVPEGFGSVTIEGQPPGEPLELLRAPVFRTTPIRIAEGDSLAWFERVGASLYELTFTRDEEGDEPVAELATDETSLTLPGGLLEADDYHAILRGVDTAGLPGFASTVRIGAVDTDTDIAPVEVTISPDGAEYVVEVVDPPEDAVGFEIQVSTDPALEDPLSIDVAATGRAVIRLESDVLYARARALVDPRTVGTFGAVASTGD